MQFDFYNLSHVIQLIMLLFILCTIETILLFFEILQYSYLTRFIVFKERQKPYVTSRMDSLKYGGWAPSTVQLHDVVEHVGRCVARHEQVHQLLYTAREREIKLDDGFGIK